MLLELDSVSFFRKEKETVLDKITLSVSAGDFLGIVGQVGSGKTAILEIMSGIISPHGGKIRTKQNLKKCILFQNSEDIFSQESVYDELALGPRHLNWPDEVIHEKILEIISLVDIDTRFLESSPFSLSDGEKRRLALALLLLMKPEIIFLDRPLQGLDPRNKKTVMTLLENIQKEENTAIVMVCPIKDMFFHADKLLFIKRGKTCFYGDTSDCIKIPEFLETFGNELPLSLILYNKLLERGMLDENLFVQNEEELLSSVIENLALRKM